MESTINTLDMNGNNYIDYTEFLAASMDQKIFMKEENLRHAFSYFDKDKDGLITVKELRNILQDTEAISDQELEEIIQEADSNSDGTVDFEEFLSMMKNKGKVA